MYKLVIRSFMILAYKLFNI